MSRWMVCVAAICVGQMALAEEESKELKTTDADIVKAKHLTEAAIHLRAAGRDEQANLLFQEAQQLIEPSLQQLADKQSQAAQLLQEIAALEQKLDRPKEVAIQVRMLSLPVEEWKLLNSGDGAVPQSKPTVLSRDWLQKLAGYEQKSLAKVLVDSSVVAKNGSAARLHNGGKFPIPVPQSQGAITVQWREFGNVVEILPVMLGLGRIDLQFDVEHSVRDMKDAVQWNGTMIPSIHQTKFSVQVETRLQETVLACQGENDGQVYFVLISPELVTNRPQVDKQPATDRELTK